MTSPVNNSTAPSNITNRTTLEESVFSRTARDIDNPFLTLFGQNLEIISELTGSPEIPEAAVTQAPRMRHVSLHEETPSTLFIPEYRRDQDRLDRSRLESTAFGRKTSQTTPLLPLTNPHLTREPSDQVTSDFARRKTGVGSPGRESGVVSDCDTMAELAALLRSEIPEGRSNLTDNHTNLQRVAEYCEANYFQTDNKRGALEETKNYTTQSLASVAYQINTLAYNFLQLLEMQSAQLAEMESQMNHISQTVMIHKEKVARREIGVLTANKSTNRQYKIIAPANPEKPIKYLRKPIDYTIFDDIGHGVRSSGTPRQKQRGSSSGSIHSVNSMPGNPIVGPAPTTKPPTPPQVSRTSSKVSVTGGGTLSKNSREYRTPPAVAPPQVPSHYAPNYPMGHPRRERGPGYSALPIANAQQQPQVGMVHPMTQQSQQGVVQPQTPPPPPPPSSGGNYGSHELHNMPPPPSPLINSQEMVLSSNQHHPMMMGGHHGPVPHGSLGMHTLSHAQGHRMSQALQQQLAASRGSGSQSPPLPPPPPPEDEHEAFGRPRTSSGVMPIVPDEDDLPGWVPKNYIEKVVAIYDYYADKDDELSFQESSVIYVLKKNDDGWWEGVMDGITGLFPGNYVEPCV